MKGLQSMRCNRCWVDLVLCSDIVQVLTCYLPWVVVLISPAPVDSLMLRLESWGYSATCKACQWLVWMQYSFIYNIQYTLVLHVFILERWNVVCSMLCCICFTALREHRVLISLHMNPLDGYTSVSDDIILFSDEDDKDSFIVIVFPALLISYIRNKIFASYLPLSKPELGF